jgi:hypothetical protein
LHQTPQNKNKNNDESLIMSHSKKYKFFTIKKLLIIFVAPVFIIFLQPESAPDLKKQNNMSCNIYRMGRDLIPLPPPPAHLIESLTRRSSI